MALPDLAWGAGAYPRAGAGLQPQPVLPTRVHCVTTHVSVALKGDCEVTSGGVDVQLGHAGSVHTRGPRPCQHGVGWVRSPPRAGLLSPPRSRGISKESAAVTSNGLRGVMKG